MAEDVGIDKLVLPVLKLDEQYSTHPKTEAVVANWCQGSGLVFGPSKTTEELRKSIDILSERLKHEKQLNERLDGEKKQWEAEMDKLQKQLYGSEHNLAATEFSLKVSKEEIVALKRKCEECDDVCDALRKERSNLESKIERLHEESSALQRMLERAEDHGADALRKQRSNLASKIQRLREENLASKIQRLRV